MDKYDKAKLKVLIKMILLERCPKKTTANQLANIINENTWGFRTDISSNIISSLMKNELKKTDNHFMNMIKSANWRTGIVYWIPSKK